ncbi:AAA family ATPase [Candidatus Pacearchaeota archaeon]|nr:AAA family ATPase [Candidatus Pacearchaeota archaeon]
MVKKKKPVKRVKKKSKENSIVRVSTGINSLDSLTEKGFEKNSTNLIIGDSGAGKTIFATQFLISGIKKNEKCLYINFEEKKKEFYLNMKRMGFNLKQFEDNGKFFFLEYTPEKVKKMLEEGGGIIESLILRKKINRVVIDSMTSFGLLFENELEKRESLLDLFNMLKKWDCTTLLTYEGKGSIDNKITPHLLELEADSTIRLYFVRGTNKQKRYLEILKMRGTKHSPFVHEFNLTNKGIVLKKRPVRKKLNISD